MSEFFMQAEADLLLWIQNTLRGAADAAVISFTSLGNAGLIWIALSLLLLCFRQTRRAGCRGLAALLIGFVLTNLTIKPLVSRPRPWLSVEGLIPLVDPGDTYSFPSGHTCAAFAAACSWQGELPKRWMDVTALALAALMSLSRLYVGVHYLSDVLGGALVGVFSAWVMRKVLEEKKY